MPLRGAEEDLASLRSDDQLSSATADNWNDWLDVIERLWMRRMHVFLWVLVTVAMSSYVAYRYPKYESTAQIMPPESAGSGLAAMVLPALSKMPGLAGLAGDLLGAKNSTAVFIKILDSRTVQDDMINRFDLRQRYHLNYWEDARKKLTSRTTITEDKKSGIIRLSVRDHDRDTARAMTNAYIDELNKVVARVSTSSARRERQFIESRLGEEKKTLDEAEKQLSHFATNTMMLDVPEQTKITVESAAKLQGELIAERAQLEGLEQIYTAENYRVRTIHARIDELERELGKINTGPIATGASQDPTNPYPSVKSLPQLGVQWIDLYRTTKIHETVFELLTQQYEIAKVQEAKEIPTVTALDPASVPERQTPSAVLIVGAGGVVGIFLGCMSVFIRYRWERWNAQDRRRVMLQRVYRASLGRALSILRSSNRWRPAKQGATQGLEQPSPPENQHRELQEGQQEEYSDRRR